MRLRELGIVAAILSVLSISNLSEAREVRDSVKIYFRQGYSILDLSIRDNRQVLERIADSLSIGYADSVYTLKKVMVVGGASPEGTIPLNKRLSEKRANVLFDYLAQYGELPDSLTSFVYLGRDWNGLVDLVEADPDVPYRDETLEYLRDIAARSEGGEKLADNNVGRLSRFKGGEPYRYMYRELFPEIRASRLYLWYEKERNPIYVPVVRLRSTFLTSRRACSRGLSCRRCWRSPSIWRSRPICSTTPCSCRTPQWSSTLEGTGASPAAGCTAGGRRTRRTGTGVSTEETSLSAAGSAAALRRSR